jgi:hypothetical protein
MAKSSRLSGFGITPCQPRLYVAQTADSCTLISDLRHAIEAIRVFCILNIRGYFIIIK